MEQLILEAASKHKDKMVIRSSQQGFMKTSSFSSLIAFSNVMAGLEEVRAVDVVYFDFGKVIDTCLL